MSNANARLLFTLVVTVLFAPALGSNAMPSKVPANSFTGRVYDLDYLYVQGWTQALIQPTAGNAELAATTQDPLLQRILEVSLLNSIEATLTYQSGEPAKLQTALVQSPTGCTQGSCVKQVKCDTTKGMCIAYIQGESGEVTTDSPRALGILLTAISKRKPVDYLQLNGREIVRVKISVPSTDH
jgi:hypothetical protein